MREAGEALKQAMMEELVEQVSRAEPEVPGPQCERCGKEMHYKGMKSKHVIAETGEMDVERAYYYCETCKSGLFPLDKRWRLSESQYSDELSKNMVWLSGLLPYSKVVET